MNVIDEIAAERQRQIDVEGWTPEHDDEQKNGEMAAAASCYAFCAQTEQIHRKGKDMKPLGYSPRGWPWHSSWWKPKSRRRDLIRAAALIVAEIERLDRLTHKATEGEADE